MARRDFSDPKSVSDGVRIACVDLPAFPLQLLLYKHPDWIAESAAVVDKDKPQGILLWVNERARKKGILPGMKYSAGLSLDRSLRAGTLGEDDIRAGGETVHQHLLFFTPEVEPSEEEPGVFWLNADGLSYLYSSLVKWARCLQRDIAKKGFQAEVAVGFSRFGTYAAAKCGRSVLFAATGTPAVSLTQSSPRNLADRIETAPIVFRSQEAEREAIRYIPIDRLAFSVELRDTLAKLAIRTLGGFLDLPVSGVQKRFGKEAVRFHQLASGELWDPLDADPIVELLQVTHVLDHAEVDSERVLTLLTGMLKTLLERMAIRQRMMTQMTFEFLFEHDGTGNRSPEGEKKSSPSTREQLRPARPTRGEKRLIELLRLRLQALVFPAGVVEIKLEAEGVLETQKQLGLFEEAPKRDLEAVRRAFADLRAEFGESAVVRARLRDGHLPEARFCWESMDRLEAPHARRVQRPPLVRRMLEKPMPLPSRPRHEPDGWLISGVEGGSVDEILGPYLVSGAWWRRTVQREYHYLHTDKGRWLWVFYDRERRRWFHHGDVE